MLFENFVVQFFFLFGQKKGTETSYKPSTGILSHLVVCMARVQTDAGQHLHSLGVLSHLRVIWCGSKQNEICCTSVIVWFPITKQIKWTKSEGEQNDK